MTIVRRVDTSTTPIRVDVAPLIPCPQCGYPVHPDTNIRGCDEQCCPNCYTVFTPEDECR